MGLPRVLPASCGCPKLFILIHLILAAVMVPASNSNSSDFWLYSPISHTILSDDIKVSYKISTTITALRIQLVEIIQGKELPLAKADIPKNSDSGTVIFPCGLLVKAGKVAFRLVTIKEEKVLARTSPIDVLWPSVSIHVPLLVETYSSDVIVQLDVASAECKLLKEKNYLTFVELIYEGTVLSPDGKGTSSWYGPTVLLSKEWKNWLMEPAYDVTLNCEYFDRAGYYKVRIRTTVENLSIVAESETIHVIWSHRYSVSVTKPSVEPCDDSLKIIYHYPRCASDRDRLRVYGKTWRGVSKPPKYIFESKVQSGRHFTKLSCEIFGEDLSEYCFSFVSTAKSGAVFELDTQCIPRIAHASDIHPTWNEWAAWGECSATCGAGVHSRFRVCKPSNLLIGCEGKSVQTQLCNKKDCPDFKNPSVEKFLDLPADCYCGCSTNITEKTRLKVNLSSCLPPIIWVLQAWPSGLMTITVHQLTFITTDSVLILRDGGSSLGSILAIFSHSNGSTEIHSTSEYARLEIQSLNGTTFDGASMTLLFERSEVPRQSMAMVQPVSRPKSYSTSAVHVTMIMLTIVLCTAAIFLITVLYLRSTKHPENSSDTSPSFSSLSQEEHEHRNIQLHTASTSTSELSDSSLLHRRSPKRKNSTPANSPEDYLHNSFLFRSASSIYTVSPSIVGTPPTRNRLLSLNVESPQSPTISWRLKQQETAETPESRKPLKSALKHRPTPSTKASLSCSDTASPVRRRGKPIGKNAKQIQRDSTTPLTASVSELSITGSEDGLEYDYYDYGCHEVPGSFFCQDPILVGWPPFIPIPPEGVDDIIDFPLQHFASSPKDDVESTKSTKSQISNNQNKCT